MLYFLKHGLVLLATPKTGSTALEQALAPRADIVLQGDPQIKHCTFHRYKWRMEKFIRIFVPDPPETAALIRHPEDWLGSWYRFRHGAWLNGTPRSTRGISFDTFVAGYLAEDQPVYAAVGRQAKFLTHPQTGAQVDHIYRYDAMAAYLAFLQARLDMPITLERVNVSPDWPLTLSPELRARLELQFKPDYDLYAAARSGFGP
ncbi:MAG: gamma-glutamyl kinase [Rhodobacteraceae bacterium]|nr:MAG: gamma-glutamyl kinase [Paracoccaceae bacterium]